MWKNEIQERITLWQLLRHLFQPIWKRLLFSLVFKWALNGVNYLDMFLVRETLSSCDSADDTSLKFLLVAPILIILLKITKTISYDFLGDNKYQASELVRCFGTTILYKKASTVF